MNRKRRYGSRNSFWMTLETRTDLGKLLLIYRMFGMMNRLCFNRYMTIDTNGYQKSPSIFNWSPKASTFGRLLFVSASLWTITQAHCPALLCLLTYQHIFDSVYSSEYSYMLKAISSETQWSSTSSTGSSITCLPSSTTQAGLLKYRKSLVRLLWKYFIQLGENLRSPSIGFPERQPASDFWNDTRLAYYLLLNKRCCPNAKPSLPGSFAMPLLTLLQPIKLPSSPERPGLARVRNRYSLFSTTC